MVLLVELNSNQIVYQYSNHNLYHSRFKYAKFIDNYPSFGIKNGYGRIIMVQWNNFLRKIKKIYKKKIISNKPIVKFWRYSRKKYVKDKLLLPKDIVDIILSYC